MLLFVSSLGGVVVPTTRPVAPAGGSTIPLIGAIVAVVFIVTLLVVGVVVMAAVLIRWKAHIRGETKSVDECTVKLMVFLNFRRKPEVLKRQL